MRAQDRFFRQMMYAVSPLLVWAAHFFFCYVYAAEAGGGVVLEVVSLAAGVMAVALLARAAWRVTRAAGKVRVLDWTTLAIALLALIGIVLSTVPIAMLQG